MMLFIFYAFEEFNVIIIIIILLSIINHPAYCDKKMLLYSRNFSCNKIFAYEVKVAISAMQSLTQEKTSQINFCQ